MNVNVFYLLIDPGRFHDSSNGLAWTVRRVDYELSIPRIYCSVCGGKSLEYDLRIPLPQDEDVLKVLRGLTLKEDEWQRIIDWLAKRLDVEVSRLHPGMLVGPPRGGIATSNPADVNHPFPGTIWVRPNVVEALRLIGATGLSYNRVELFGERSLAGCPPDELPELWELTVNGRAWRVGMTPELVAACKACGRSKFTRPDYYEVDKSRWDGSDFCCLDLSSTRVVVTSRIKKLFEKNRFSNVQVDPTGEHP